MGRENAIANEHKKSTEGAGARFFYVDVRALERLGINQMKLGPGDNFIRIISPTFSQYDPNNLPFYGKEVAIHSNIGADRRTFICMRQMKNQPCAVCEYADKIRAQNPDDKRLSELWPSTRYLFFVYDVKDQSTEAKGLHWLDAPRVVKDNIVAISKDRRTGSFVDVSDPKSGADVEFERVGSGIQTKYEGFKLSNNGTPPDVWYQNVPDDFEEFLLYPEYGTVYAAVYGSGPGAVIETREAPSVASTSEPAVVTDPSPVRERSAPAQPAPAAPAPAQPAPAAPESASVGSGHSAPAPTVRDRGNSPIQPDVQNRINEIMKGAGK